jgi:hypothetical protein
MLHIKPAPISKKSVVVLSFTHKANWDLLNSLNNGCFLNGEADYSLSHQTVLLFSLAKFLEYKLGGTALDTSRGKFTDVSVSTHRGHAIFTFTTELRECFEQTPLIEQLSDTLRTTKIEDITELTDNGMGMNVSIKSRVTNGKQADSTVFNLELTPIRTFYEVVAVPGAFTMRWKREGTEIKVRLIEQMAHRWRYDQMEKIAAFLKDSLPDVTILM